MCMVDLILVLSTSSTGIGSTSHPHDSNVVSPLFTANTLNFEAVSLSMFYSCPLARVWALMQLANVIYMSSRRPQEVENIYNNPLDVH